jgi:multisubunit Na+/H+ antiporter MnhG subunit
MNDTTELRANALRRMDAARRNFRLAVGGAFLFEGVFLIGILRFADLHDRLHLLIISCTGIIYIPLLLGLVALGAYMDRCTLRVLARLDDSGS